MTQSQNSAFKVKMATVPNVAHVLPEAGAFTISEHDGKVYYADKYGWHQAEQEWGLITLFIDFDGTNQFTFSFAAPVTSTLTINNGDGSIVDVAGQGATLVDYTTTYVGAGTYIFTVLGDTRDITDLTFSNQPMAIGDLSSLALMPNLVNLTLTDAINVYGDLTDLFANNNLFQFIATRAARITGNLSAGDLTAWDLVRVASTKIFGDLSLLDYSQTSGTSAFNATRLQFNSIQSITLQSTFLANDCNWTSRMVDDALISFANGSTTGKSIEMAGNNEVRTSRSDAAKATLEGAGCTITVNE